MQPINSTLELRFYRAPGASATRVTAPRQEPPQRIVRAFPLADGAALVHLHNLSGGILGGDALALDVEVAPGAAAQITTTGASRIYPRRPLLPPSRVVTRLRVAAGGLLEYLPDALIPFAGAEYTQRTTAELAEGAGLLWWESVAPGRKAGDEVFAYESLRLDLAISACGVPVAVERLHLEPRRRSPASPVRFGLYRYVATFYACLAGADANLIAALEEAMQVVACRVSAPGRMLAGASALAAHGVVARLLSADSRSIHPALVEFWRCAKHILFGADIISPRKTY